jgi:hypothetical protein
MISAEEGSMRLEWMGGAVPVAGVFRTRSEKLDSFSPNFLLDMEIRFGMGLPI